MCTILCAPNLALLPPWRYAAGSLCSPEIAHLVNCSRYGSANFRSQKAKGWLSPHSKHFLHGTSFGSRCTTRRVSVLCALLVHSAEVQCHTGGAAAATTTTRPAPHDSETRLLLGFGRPAPRPLSESGPRANRASAGALATPCGASGGARSVEGSMALVGVGASGRQYGCKDRCSSRKLHGAATLLPLTCSRRGRSVCGRGGSRGCFAVLARVRLVQYCELPMTPALLNNRR